MTNTVKIAIIIVGISVILSGLWYSEIPHGIWLARNVYHAQTIKGQIEAVKAENARLKKLVDDGKAAQAAAGTAGSK